MSDTNPIVDKILSDAKIETEKIIAAAKIEADELLASANEHVAGIKKAGAERAKAVAAETAKSRGIVSQLDGKKLMLGARRTFLDGVYSRATESVKKDKKEYQKWVSNMLLAESEDGDSVIISKFDKEIITAELVKTVADKKKIKLKLATHHGDFFGGVILEGKFSDKNLTLELIMEDLKVETEAEISKSIFAGEEKE